MINPRSNSAIVIINIIAVSTTGNEPLLNASSGCESSSGLIVVIQALFVFYLIFSLVYNQKLWICLIKIDFVTASWGWFIPALIPIHRNIRLSGTNSRMSRASVRGN